MTLAASPPESVASRFQPVVAAEQHLAQKPAYFLLRNRRVELVKPFEHGHAWRDRFLVVLREVADRDFMAPLHLA